MKYFQILIVFCCLSIELTAQKTTRPQWFFNDDCVSIKNLITHLRTQEINISYELSELSQKKLNSYLYDNKNYTYPSAKCVIIVNGFTEVELMNNLIKAYSINDVLTTNNKMGIYVARTNFYGKQLFYLYLIVSHDTSNNYYTRIK